MSKQIYRYAAEGISEQEFLLAQDDVLTLEEDYLQLEIE